MAYKDPEKRRRKQREYRQKNKERCDASRHKYRQSEKGKLTAKRWVKNTPATVKASRKRYTSSEKGKIKNKSQCQKWRKENKEYLQRPENKAKAKLHCAKYYQEHKNKLSKLNSQWRKEHPEKCRKYTKKFKNTPKGKLCMSRQKIKRRQRYPEYSKTEGFKMAQRKNGLKQKHGITIRDYNLMSEQQKGLAQFVAIQKLQCRVVTS